MDKTVEYWKNMEYAVKTVAPYWEHKDEWEVFDRLSGKFLDISDFTKQHLFDLTSDVIWNWHSIKEEEYNNIVKWEGAGE
jgi:nitrate reductase alpha subunit